MRLRCFVSGYRRFDSVGIIFKSLNVEGDSALENKPIIFPQNVWEYQQQIKGGGGFKHKFGCMEDEMG